MKTIDRHLHGISDINSPLLRTFTLNISLVILLFILGIFIGILLNNENLMKSQLETRAKSHFKDIVITRSWNAQYGGVYVEKKEGVESSPYLEVFDFKAEDGAVYTMKNHALMTREISDIAEEEGMYKFHITSLDPINPGNDPDSFERGALESFEKGVKEVFEKERNGERVFLRYMAPLMAEESCLQCHATQGYKAGDIRGGISVKFDITDIEHNLTTNRYVLMTLFLVTFVFIVSIIYFFIIKLKRKLFEAHRIIREMAVTDDLTKLHNRRYFLSRLKHAHSSAKRYHHSLSCILMDIDSFKTINDQYGHDAGDMVLQAISEVLRNNCRATDIVSRYGGEEFIEMLPETSLEGAFIIAERIRSILENEKILINNGVEISVTASFGIASVAADEWDNYSGAGDIINEADRALYRAKKNGRNRIETNQLLQPQ